VTESQLVAYLDYQCGKEPVHEILPGKEGGFGGFYLGSRMACSTKWVDQLGVRHIFQTARALEDFYPPLGRTLKAHEANGVQVYRLGWVDDSSFVIEDFETPLRGIHTARTRGEAVLVNCAQGKSRSTTLVVAYVMCVEGQNVADTVGFVQSKRSIAQPNPGFIAQLETFAQSDVCAKLKREFGSS